MSNKTQRREPRINISLPVTLQLPDGELAYEIANASHRGIFIACPQPLPLRKLVRFSTQLSEDEEPLQMLGLVAHTVNPAEARESGKAAGMGVQLYSVGRDTRARWRTFISEKYENDPSVRDLARAQNLPRVSLHLRAMEQLQTFAGRDLQSGNIYVRTANLHPVDTAVICAVVHPQTGQIFDIEAHVTAVKEAPRRERGMRLEFVEFDAQERAQFEAFVRGNAEA
ncbi:PilZ domain-containing protein [Bradymonas sediminis]|nr:PilZ domain-containing protein [Bradymonas sediminis]TDP76051.1 PilZ domain-containing protein [Bradymonas sediminis]